MTPSPSRTRPATDAATFGLVEKPATGAAISGPADEGDATTDTASEAAEEPPIDTEPIDADADAERPTHDPGGIPYCD